MKPVLRSVFSEAVEISDPAERTAFLDSACQGDLVLRSRVDQLLAAEARVGNFLGERGGPTELSVLQEKVGSRIGRYRLLERIGHGGYGIVYLAEQEEPVRRPVALKVIKLGMDTSAVVARFEAERQTLAVMDHPNIAHVFDAGATEAGRPFFVMELVRGLPITAYCEQKSLTIRQRLELFIQVCNGLQHAHQKGIIHRDLKPSNILVTEHDGAPAPKVIDFGIAKATDQSVTRQVNVTGEGEFIGTPAYMSPEQVQNGSRDIDTRSDIYSLGVILYELMTGFPPFDPKALAKAGLDEMCRLIRESDPPRPSTRLTKETNRPHDRGSTRATPRLPVAAVRGDVDCIVMKCLEKDRARRYESANALATDIQRHLDNETISARPPTTFYRFQKIVRRNPKVVALTTLLFLALATGLGGVLFMNVRLTSANRQKELANVRLAAKLRDFEWQKVEALVATGKRSDALALLNDMLRRNPYDAVAATRILSMLNGGNFGLPRGAPLQHEAAVNSVSVSADGKRVLTASSDATARLWDRQSGSLLASFMHTGKVTSARFADDDRLVMAQCQDGTFWLWDSNGSNFLLEATQPPNWTVTPAFTRDRKRLALPEADNSLRIWDLPGRRPVCSLKSPAKIVHASFSPNTNLIAVSASDGSIAVWKIHDSRPAELLVKLSIPGRGNWSDFSPDGRTLISRWSQSLTFWDAQTWTRLHEFKAHEGDILMMEISPDGRRLVTAPWNEPLKSWDIASGKMIGQPIQAEQPHCYFRLSPDGMTVVTWSQSGVVRVWDPMTGQPLTEPMEHQGPATETRFTPNGRSLVSSSQDGTAQVWDVQRGRPALLLLKAERSHSSACFTRDGRYVLGSDGARVLKYDAVTGTPVGDPVVHADPVSRLKASPNGKSFATAAWVGNAARIWDLQTGAPRTPWLQHRERLLGVAFSPDSRLVATASQDTAARIWDAESGEPKSPPLRHDADVLNVAFRGDSLMLLSTSVDGTARLWSTKDGHPVWPEPIRHKGIVWTAEFDPEGRRIVTASADRSAMVWDAQSRRPLIQPIMHERGVAGARFSPDGRRVLTWSYDGTARVWDAQNGEPVSQPMRHRDKVTVADFSPDGARVLTGSSAGVVQLWDASTGYPLSEPLQNEGDIQVVEFSPDGRRFLSFGDKGALIVADIVTPPVPMPSWFCDLVGVLAGKRLTASRDAEPVARDSLQPFRHRFDAARDSDFYSRWARWFLWERMNYPVPEFVP